MNKDIWYDYFLDALYKKYPKKNQLAESLMDLLEIEREAVYRRLRKDVAFSFNEIIKIASAWQISLNEIADIYSGNIPFFMRPLNFISPSELELDILKDFTKIFSQIEPSDDAEFMEICNKLPRSITSGFSHLNQFLVFKCLYQYGNNDKLITYSDACLPEKTRYIMSDYYDSVKNVSSVCFIFDGMLFDYLVRDINYFLSIKLITEKEKELIKKDILDMLNYISESARNGYFKNSKNKFSIYISRINIDSNYCYLYTKSFKICSVQVFNRHDICSSDVNVIEHVRKWMQYQKRNSTQISEVDEVARIEYFTRQYKLLEEI